MLEQLGQILYADLRVCNFLRGAALSSAWRSLSFCISFWIAIPSVENSNAPLMSPTWIALRQFHPLRYSLMVSCTVVSDSMVGWSGRSISANESLGNSFSAWRNACNFCFSSGKEQASNCLTSVLGMIVPLCVINF